MNRKKISKNLAENCSHSHSRTRPKPLLNPLLSFAYSIRVEMVERECSPEEIGKILEYSKLLQTCPSSFDGEELLLTNPAFVEDLIVQIDSPTDPTTAKLKNLLQRSQEYLLDDDTTASRYFSDPTRGRQIGQQHQQQLGALTTYMPWTLVKEIRTRSNALSLKIEKIFDPKFGSEQEYDVKTTATRRSQSSPHPLHNASPPQKIESWRSRNLVERTSFVPVNGAKGVLQKLSAENAPAPYYGLGLNGSTMYAAATEPDQEYLSDDTKYVLFTATFLVGALPGSDSSDTAAAPPALERQYVVNDYRPYDDDNKPSDRRLQRGFSVKPNGAGDKADLVLQGVADADDGELVIFGELDASYFYTLQVTYAPLRSASSSFYSLHRSDDDDDPTLIKTSRFRSARVFEVSPTAFYVGGTNVGSSRKPKIADAFHGTLAELQIAKTWEAPRRAFCDFVVEKCLLTNSL